MTTPVMPDQQEMSPDDDYQTTARKLVRSYVIGRLDKSDPPIELPLKDIYVVWFCKTLLNWKTLISTNLPDGMYYEVTRDGLADKIYIDAYRKIDNVPISLGQLKGMPA